MRRAYTLPESEEYAAMNRTSRDIALGPQDLARLLVSRTNSGDIEGMVALYESDAVLACGDGRIAVGTEAIRRFYIALLATGRKFALGDQQPAMVHADLALTSTRLPNGIITAEVARKQSDGSWLWVIDQPSIGV
jgi:ketosteroid isomerase-like protein